MDLTEEQWTILRPLIPEPKAREGQKGRPPVPARAVLDGILWILRTGAPWADMPGRYPPYQTCHRRFQQWNRDGTLKNILHALAQDLLERGEIDIGECFIDGTFVSAKKGGFALEKLSGAKARRSWQLQTALVFLSPVALKALRPTR